MNRVDVKQIVAMLAERVEDVCRWLLPGGSRVGGEWRAGSIDGEAGDSLGVNLSPGKAGIWRDFASDERGGDLLDLICAVKGEPRRESIKTAKDFLGLKDDAPEFFPKRKAYKKPAKPKCSKPAGPVQVWFAMRGISDKTLAAYKVGAMESEELGHVAVFPYLHGEDLKFIKYRPLEHKDRMWTSKDSEPILFGWQVVPGDARTVVVCEGEIDCMSFYEQGIPAMSVPRGAGTGAQQDEWLSNEWDNVAGMDAVYLAFDNDKQGKLALEQVVDRIGRHRCFVLDFDKYKDANEAHQDGANLKDILAQAKTCDPPELRSSTEFVEDVVDIFEGRANSEGDRYPWTKTYANLRARLSEISVWSGFNGSGKSQVLGHVLTASVADGRKWCIASMEFKPPRLLARLYRQASGEARPSPALCRGALANFFDGNLYLFDVQGTAKSQKILDIFEYAFRRYGCQFFLVDSLAKCGFSEDDYNKQKKFLDTLMEFGMRYNVHVHVVTHSRKRSEEDDMPGKMDVKGTGAITDMVDNVFVIWRNKPKEENPIKHQGKPDCVINCCKQRNGEWEGKVGLFFDRLSFQYLEDESSQSHNYAGAGHGY